MKAQSYALNAMILLLFLSNSFLLLLPMIVLVLPLFELEFMAGSFDPLILMLSDLSLKPAQFGFVLMLLSWVFYAVYVDFGLRSEPAFRFRMALLLLLCIAQTMTPAYYFTAYFGSITFT